jgi:peptidoglycan-associated lipoprotein
MQTTRLSLVVLATLVATGCGSSAPATETTARNADTGGDGRNAGPTMASTDTRGGDGGGCGNDPVYFAFDSSDLDSSSRDRLNRSARCIQAGNAGSVTITGMADPRGTEEYNLALGERRASTVAGYVQSLGVEPHKIRTHSVGEEMATGGDESGWSRDRRAELQSQ